jgi:hypothetical protein
MEVGSAIWHALYDWQIYTRQPLNIVIAANGRYVMGALLSNFVLRVDVDPAYIGPGDDALQ